MLACNIWVFIARSCTPKRPELSVQNRTHCCKQKKLRMFEYQDTKEAMICNDKKNGFIKFTNFYQINYNFSYFSIKPSCVTGRYWTGEQCGCRYCTLWRKMQYRHSTLKKIIINLTQNSCKLTEKTWNKGVIELVHFYSQLVPIFPQCHFNNPMYNI